MRILGFLELIYLNHHSIGTRVNFCVNFDVYRVFSLVHVELIWTMVCWPLVTVQKVVMITG